MAKANVKQAKEFIKLVFGINAGLAYSDDNFNSLFWLSSSQKAPSMQKMFERASEVFAEIPGATVQLRTAEFAGATSKLDIWFNGNQVRVTEFLDPKGVSIRLIDAKAKRSAVYKDEYGIPLVCNKHKPVVHVVDNVREPTQNLANYLNTKFADITYSTNLHEAGSDPQTECIIMLMDSTTPCKQIRIYVDYANSKVTGQYCSYLKWSPTWWSGAREFGSLKILENWVTFITQKRMDQLPTDN